MRMTTDPKQYARAREREKADQLTSDRSLRNTMASADGRRGVWLQLAKLGVFSANLDLEPAIYGFKMGQRAVGLELWNDVVRVAPVEFTKMVLENAAIEKVKEDDDRSKPDDPDTGGSAEDAG